MQKSAAQNEICEVVEVTLGGYSQKILLDGKSRANPLVICLHGGPGTPIPFNVGCRGLFPEITEKLTLVCWDQLGCGVNNYPIDDSFTIDDFVTMTVDLIMEIRRRFPDNKIILFGMSWGSILTAKAAGRAGELIDGAVTYGQVLCEMPFCEEVYCALEGSKLPPKKKEKLQQMKKEHTIENAKLIMSWIRKYTEGYQCRAGENMPVGGMILGLLRSPDYRLRDFMAVLVNGYVKNTSLLQQLVELDLRKEVAEIDVPYTVIQGDTDIVTPTKTVSGFISRTGNRRIKFVLAENSGHMPDKRAMDLIIEEILAQNQP